jgi:hypothetical protein
MARVPAATLKLRRRHCCRQGTIVIIGTGSATFPKALFSLLLPMANSSQLVRPMITASAASRRSTAVALYRRLTYPSRMCESLR